MFENVKSLLTFIKENNVPGDAKIVYQRIEDRYFDGIDISGMSGTEENGAINGIYPPGSKAKGWETIKIKGENYWASVNFNKNIEKGKLVKEGKLDPDNVGRYYWDEKYKDKQQLIDLNDPNLLEQYVEVENIFYDIENNILCVSAHI